jgi:ribonuclease P protein component
MSRFSLTKKEKIRKRADFVALNLHGRRCYTEHFLVILKRNERDIARVGITTSKKVGNSVRRNRIKRLIREFFRLNKEQMPRGYDILVVALRRDNKLNFSIIQEELGGLLIKHDTLCS